MGADPHTPYLEHVVAPALVEEMTGRVLDEDVACLEPLAEKRLPRQLMPTPVGSAQRITFYQKHAGLAKGHVPSFLVDDPCLVSLDKGATAVWVHIMHAVRDEDVAGLR